MDSVITPVLGMRKLSLRETKTQSIAGKPAREAGKILDTGSLYITLGGSEGRKVRQHMGMNTSGL